MDDIIVIILTLIFIIAGIFGQMKKRQLPPEPISEEIPEDDNFWDIPDEESEAKEQLRAQTRASEYIEENYEPQVTESKFKWDKGGRKFSHDLLKSDPLKQEFSVPKKRGFPLKKAVIYSEILNRKYFNIS
jgi:hypothetical protein